jgi:amino acid transporter/nucleotide-binding universal stress UspA family protein
VSTHLERDLGLYATITISIGAMVGSGIFVLPGLAAKIAGPAVVLAYLLAGLVVLPAALSKAEMATAMPEAGGTYLFIDRAMGPLYGTIAGVGAWFSLVFKSAFALVGLGAYLLLLAPLSNELVTLVGLALAVLLVAVNLVGVEQSGLLQSAIVTVVLLSLLVFIADGLTFVDRPRYHPFFSKGFGGVLTATGFVFVSYAGVTKVASVAEEVEHPGRNIPLGILLSIGVMLLVYTLVTFVVVGVTPIADLEATLTPMAVAADQFFGAVGRAAITAVAILALTSMANAGILSAARFPFAMSRDDLAPPALGRVHDRFRTPVYAVLFTGVVLVVLVAFVPVVDLAKLASAFQILVFVFVNVALVTLREADLDWYDPAFRSPAYPWVQLFGVVGGLFLLTGLGALPLLGGAGIVVGGVGWYYVYGRSRTDREGAALAAIRRSTGAYSVDALRSALADWTDLTVLVAVGPRAGRRAGTLLDVADAVVTDRGGQVELIQFEELPAQLPLAGAATASRDSLSTADVADLVHQVHVPVEVGEVVSHEVERAVVNYAGGKEVDVVVGAWDPRFFHGEFLGHDVDWYIKRAPCDLVFVRDRGLDAVDEITVVADRGPYDPLVVVVADALARAHGATVRFVYAMTHPSRDRQVASVSEYLERVASLCTAATDVELLRTDDREAALLAAGREADLVVAGTSAHHLLYDVTFGALPDTLAVELDCTVVLVHSRASRRRTLLRYLLERLAF